MKHYFLIDSLETLRKSLVHVSESEYVAQDHVNHPTNNEPVIAWVIFTTIGYYHTFCNVKGVHPLPDALDNEPLAHEHMYRLKRVHGLYPRHTNENDVTWHDDEGAEQPRPTTKKIMNKLAAEHWPSFFFKIF